MNNPFRHFEKIFVISEYKNTERRQHIRDTLSLLNIDFEFFDAIIGNDLSEQEIDAVYDEKKAKNHKTIKRPLSKPEIGCALSHISIYDKILKQNLSNALIFEDDVTPNYSNIAYINKAIKEIPKDWDVLLLGTLNHNNRAPLLFKLKLIFYYPLVKLFFPTRLNYQYKHLRNLHHRNYSKSLMKPGHFQGCHAYAISRTGVEKFKTYHNKIITPIDYMLSVMVLENHLNAFMTKKVIFNQNKGFESSIESSRLFMRKNI